MLFLFISLWPLIFKGTELYFKRRKNINDKSDIVKISRNITSSSHAVILVISGLISYYTKNETLLKNSTILSISYYIWDTYYILLNKLTKERMYIYHHFVAFYLLENILNTNNNCRYLLYNSLILAEISNFSLYPVYHYTKILDKTDKRNKKFLFNIKFAQMIWYVFIRIIVFGYINYFHGNIIPVFLRSFITSIYFMGLYWACVQIKNLVKEYKKITILKNSSELINTAISFEMPSNKQEPKIN